ncbi:phage portal protein [Spirosoma sp. KCTC 42546]|uniref:phage portal protein n=1 Tax=Spirosoma sp. KCTC 42546 TaxID=2520506 RepID=UPI001159C161|nr:phage portal protein [Spirosoma sp. KCTC 42546]QDK80847.1 phage portal protein [Spirosoma sp. KCTC 42546]
MNLTELRTALAVVSGQALDIPKVIEILKAKQTPLDIKDFIKQYSPSGHKALDPVYRKDKIIKKPTGEIKDGVEVVTSDTVKVNRQVFPLQKLIVERAVSFLFGNPVKINSEGKTDKEKKVVAALTRILYDNKINSFNRRIAREMFRSTQVAECWFPVEGSETHSDYGFDTKFKMRVTAFNPWDGNEFYPLYDETGDLIAFSRLFVRMNDEGQKVTHFETYTAEEKIAFKQEGGTWEQTERTVNVIKKIPVIYGHQEQVEWQDVQWSIERLEYLLSNFADTNDYHAAPKIFIEGKIAGFGQKGEPGQILQGEKDSKAYYLSWNHATDAVKLEIETLLRFIFSFTQTPDISFDSVKGLREISGEALKMLFLDAHLKVQNKREVFDEYLQRRINIIKSFIAYMSIDLKKEASTLAIEPEIQPFIINDEKAMIENLMTATGNQPILSQKTAIAKSGLVDDVEAEYKLIQEEETRAKSFDILNPIGA